jgi:hypothetical protein
VWPIHLNYLFLISKFISSCPVTFHRSLLEIIFGHHILNITLRHLFTKVCILRWISYVTSQVSHPYKSTDFTQALNILIFVSFRNNLDSSHRLNRVIFQHTKQHTLALPSSRNVDDDEKQLIGKNIFELFLLSVQVS